MKRFDSDDARRFADLLGVQYDLNFVLAATDRLLQELAKPEQQRDTIAARAYWSAATIAYMRCFGSGKRQGIQTTMYNSLTGATAAHQHIADTRNKHVAHPVNAFEEVAVGFVLGAGPSVVAQGVAHLWTFRICDNPDGVRNLQKLANHALDNIKTRLKTLENALLKVGQNTPRSQLEKLPNLGTQIKGDPGRPR